MVDSTFFERKCAGFGHATIVSNITLFFCRLCLIYNSIAYITFKEERVVEPSHPQWCTATLMVTIDLTLKELQVECTITLFEKSKTLLKKIVFFFLNVGFRFFLIF